MATKTADDFRTIYDTNVKDMLAQIGRMNLLAISGGRVTVRSTGITLPVGHGYSVTVDLTAGDDYTVRRVFTRGGKTWIKGERTMVYCDQLADAAYYASCYVSYDADTWPTKGA